MYATAPPKPTRPASASSSNPAGGIRHEDVAPQALKPAATASASVSTAVLAGAAYCYAKAMEDKYTFAPRLVLAALRSIPSVVLMLSMRSVPGNRTYASSIQWGLLLCAAGDALIEMDPLFKSLPIGGRRVRPLSCGLALFMLARAAYAHAFVSDMPSPLRAIGTNVLWVGASLGVLIYRVLELTFIVPTPVVGFSPELLGLVVDGKRVRMFAYTLSTSLLLVLALACCFAPAAAKGHAPGVGSSQVWAVVGCVCFIVSDTLLTYTRHVQPFPFSEGIFLGFYVLGQTALTMSVPAWGRSTKQDEGGVEGEETKEERTQNASKKME